MRPIPVLRVLTAALTVAALAATVGGCGVPGGEESAPSPAVSPRGSPSSGAATTGPTVGASSASAGSATQPSGPGASTLPRWLTPADDGGTFAMTVGEVGALVVPDPLAPDPVVDGDSVEVVTVNNIDASGQREWELRALHPGRTVLSGLGEHPYSVTLEVVADPVGRST